MRVFAFFCYILSLILGLGAIIVMLAYHANYRDKRAIRLVYFLTSYLLTISVLFTPFIINSNFFFHYISLIDYQYFYLFLAYSSGLVIYSYSSFIFESVGFSISKTARAILFIVSFLPLYLYIPVMILEKSINHLAVILYAIGFVLILVLLFTLFILLRMYKKLIGLWRKIAYFLIIFHFLYTPFAIIDLFFPGIRLVQNEVFPFSILFFLAFNVVIICRVLNNILRRNPREKLENHQLKADISREALIFYGISEREREIALAILEGKTNNEIAEEKLISLTTVKKHVYNIFQKTNARNRIELANILRNGK